jgi:cytochrome b
MSEPKRLIWDLPLRLFHWLLVLSLCASWLTAELGFEWTQVHFYLGYWTLGLLLFRIIWGFVGPKHARFSSFLKGPSTLVSYLKGAMTGTPTQMPGHNPVGGLMVIVMILLVGVQAVTGLFASDDIAWSGPYSGAVSSSTVSKLTALHHQNFNFILAAAALHILAILFYWLVKKQNLVVPMITGLKSAQYVPEHEAIRSSQWVRALIVILVSAGAVYWLISAAPEPADPFAF